MEMRIFSKIRVLTALGIHIAYAGTASAADITKGGSGTDLNDGASWGGTAPTLDDTATWSSGSLGANLTLGSDASWGGIKVTGAVSDIGISGLGTLILGGGGIDLSASTVNLSLSNNITLNAAQTWKAAAGKTLSVSGVVSGSAGLTIGALAQSVNFNSYLTAVNQEIATNASLTNLVSTSGTMNGGYIGRSISGNGYLLSNNHTTATYWLEVVDGSYTKGVAITLTQNGTNIDAKATDAKYVDGSSLGYNFNTGGIQGTVATSASSPGYGAATTTLQLASATGTIVLSGVNTYSGPTTVNSGILKAGVASVAGVGGAFGNNSALSFADAGATGIDLNGFNTQVGSITGGGASGGNITLGSATLTVGGDHTSPGAYAGIISGTGGLTKIGSGTLLLTGMNSYTGATTITGGTLEYRYGTSGAALAGSLSGSGSLKLTRSGTAYVDLRLQGDNSGFTGAVTVDGGGYETTLRCNSNTALTASNAVTLINAGSLSSWGYTAPEYNITIGSLASGDSNTYVRLGGGSGLTYGLTVGALGTNTTFAGVIKNDAGGIGFLTKVGSGTLTLTNANLYTGATTVNGGKLSIGSTGTINNTSSVVIGAGEFNYNNSTTALNKGVSFSGSSGTLSGTGTITPAVIVTSGNIQTGGSAVTATNPAATLGKQTFSGGITYNQGSIFEWNLTANTETSNGARGINYDAINAASVATSGSGAIFRIVLDGTQNFSESFWNSTRTWSDIFKTADAGTDISIAAIFGSNFQYGNSAGTFAAPSTQGSFTISGTSLTWTAVPEPTSALAGLLLGAGLLRRRRR